MNAARLIFAAGFALAAGALLGLLWGMQIGTRDAQAWALADRMQAAAQCTDGELPVLMMRDARRPAKDLWTCTSGSLRRAGK